MKQLYFLNEEEKNRILNLHESVTKRHYLSEQPDEVRDTPYNKQMMRKYQNTTPKVASKVASKVAPKVSPKVAQNKQLAASRQQIITNTQTTTKSIQKLLGLPETGIMDSSLLQKINEKINGNPQTPTPETNTQPRPQVEPLQQITPAGVITPKLTTMSPEQLSTGLNQQLTGLKK